jgi:hypothetical protein
LVRPSLLLGAVLVVGGGLYAQRGQRGGAGFGGGGQIYVAPGTKTVREIPSRSTGTPEAKETGSAPNLCG